MHTTPDPTLQAQLTAAYAAARAGLPQPHELVVLHIGDEQCGLAVGQAAQPAALYTLPMGAQRTAREHFRSDPPSALAMENAIAAVEDVVMPLRPLLARDAVLVSADAELRELASLADVASAAPLLPLEVMESLFDRLTQVILGTPAARMGLPESRYFAARLLILREFMHHMQFANLQLLRS